MKHLFAVTIVIDQIKELWSRMGMNLPNHFEQRPRHWHHRAPFRPIVTRHKQTPYLALDGPPIMDVQRMIDQDNGIGCVESRNDQIAWPPPVNNPLLVCHYFVMALFHFLIGSRNPTGFPLKVIDRKERECMGRAQVAA